MQHIQQGRCALKSATFQTVAESKHRACLVDWGVARNSSTNIGYDDDPYLDFDDIPGVGPENINIEVPENTTDEYVVVVHDYSGSGDPTISNDVTVNVYLDGSLTATQTIGISGEDTYRFFSIDYASGVVTPMFNACNGGSSSTCDDAVRSPMMGIVKTSPLPTMIMDGTFALRNRLY